MSDLEFKTPETGITAIVGLVETYNQWKNKNQGPRGFEKYHPSAFGHCLRLMQYQRYEERGYISVDNDLPEPQMIRIWDNGHAMHDRWRSYFEGIGVLKGYWQCSNPLCKIYDNDGNIDNSLINIYKDGGHIKHSRMYGKDNLQGCFKPDKCICGCKNFIYHEVDVVSEELNFYGHCDLILDFSNFNPSKFDGVSQRYMPEYLPKKPVVVDMKTINMFDFQNLDKTGPDHAYEVQLTIYSNILDCEYGVLIYENKNNSKIKAYKIDRNADTDFQEIRRQAIEMNDMVEVTDEDGNIRHLLPPPRPNFVHDSECSRCKYASLCHRSSIWNDPELDKKRKEFYGTLLK